MHQWQVFAGYYWRGQVLPAHRTPQEPQKAVLKGVHSAAGVYEKLKHKQLQLAECVPKLTQTPSLKINILLLW
jgi:hypothetical protein